MAVREAEAASAATGQRRSGGSNGEGGSQADGALRAIELGCSRFLHSALDAAALATAAECICAVISTQLHQDFFRLRGGLRVLRDSEATQECVSAVAGSPPMSEGTRAARDSTASALAVRRALCCSKSIKSYSACCSSLDLSGLRCCCKNVGVNHSSPARTKHSLSGVLCASSTCGRCARERGLTSNACQWQRYRV